MKMSSEVVEENNTRIPTLTETCPTSTGDSSSDGR